MKSSRRTASIAVRSRSERRSPRRASSTTLASRSRCRSASRLTGRPGGGTIQPLIGLPWRRVAARRERTAAEPGGRAGHGSAAGPPVDSVPARARGERMSTTAPQAAPERHVTGAPVGTVHVFDPHPLNWLFITWNTMEEPVRTDHEGHIVLALAEDAVWRDDGS